MNGNVEVRSLSIANMVVAIWICYECCKCIVYLDYLCDYLCVLFYTCCVVLIDDDKQSEARDVKCDDGNLGHEACTSSGKL